MKFFSFFNRKKKQAVPVEIDVINRPEVTGHNKGLSRLRHPDEGYGAAWYLPNEVKWQMLQDAQVFAAIMIWKMGVLIDGYKISSAVEPEDPRYKKAKEIADFCNYCAENMQGSFHMKMLQLLDCCIWGHKAASQVYRDQTYGKWKGKIVVDYLRVIPNRDYRIRVDDFNMPLGLQAVGENQDENIIGMGKFLFCSF